ncbi:MULTISPECIES: SRPBCC domain-containing protein [unclassified Peribacillus]|uniref:SRPBCC family protein n=1 Tax=unclassified Peribacillus TaxID=2675266 RepID=UPI001911997A|nr:MULTISPECIES: SRPBCC domain-containing protein [unclassified Peribacillus]MBK5441595.1 SRPBCC domain-containing protein [Peribacillus sp. TH24]MBK5458480.1 SRPBCC domain-containing protein [Peribacillus sp. TH27]WMX58186.1 SRPBCC domain-containing protein [Peribacillus sp. R9-11]
MVNTSTTTLTMIRRFDVPAERIFDAWLSPEMMRKWFFTMESTNKVANNEPIVGGSWEIVDHREGKDYRAVGKYIEVDSPSKLVFTFKMPQFSDTEDRITVEINPFENGCEMTFTQLIVVPHEEGWTEEDIEKAHDEYNSQTEQGWGYMFEGLKQLVETGKINYPS